MEKRHARSRHFPQALPSLGFGGLAIVVLSATVDGAEIRHDAIASLGSAGTHPTYRISDTAGLPTIGRSFHSGHVEWAGFWFPRVEGTSGIPDGSAEEPIPGESMLPTVTRFVGVFPNPVGTHGEFRFDLAPPAWRADGTAGGPTPTESAGAALVPVRLELFDASGRVSAVLLETELAPGVHRLAWPSGSVASGRLANGVYFLRFRGGSHVETRRVTLLR